MMKFRLHAVLVLFFALAACAGGQGIVLRGEIVRPPYGYKSYCNKNPNTAFCTKQTEDVGEYTYEYAKILNMVKAHFIHVADVKEHWSSHAEAVLRGETFEGDCDDFALTCAELAIKRGIPKDQIYLAACMTEKDNYHLICIINGYALDNRQKFVTRWNRLPYLWINAMQLSEPGKWKRIKIDK